MAVLTDHHHGGDIRQFLDPYGVWLTGEGKKYRRPFKKIKLNKEDFGFILFMTVFKGVVRDEENTQAIDAFVDLFKRVNVARAGEDILINGLLVGEVFHSAEFQSALEDLTPDRFVGGANIRKHLALPLPLRAGSVDPDGHAPRMPAKINVEGQPQVIGVIDDGINFVHPRFRDAHGKTRCAFAWDMDGMKDNRDKTVQFGRSYVRPEIQDAIDGSPDDMPAILRRLDLISFTDPDDTSLTRSASHGTHIADLATGYDQGGQDRQLVAVQLPADVTRETSGATLGAFMISGIDYILRCARAMSDELTTDPAQPVQVPVTINASFGVTGGPHDGTGIFEQAIEVLIASHNAEGKGEAVMVLPSGNNFLDRLYLTGKPGEDQLEARWAVPPGDQTSSYLELWLPGPVTAVTLDLAPPGQPAKSYDLTATRPPEPIVDVVSGKTIGTVSLNNQYIYRAVPSGIKQFVLIALAPTDIPEGGLIPAPNGVWDVQVTAKGMPHDGVIEARIQRDDAAFGYLGRGQQSYFVDPEYQKFDKSGDVSQADTASPVRKFGSLSGLAAGARPVVAASHYFDPAHPVIPVVNSGAGLAERDVRNPSGAAPGDTSRARPGILAATNGAAAQVALSGTSAATAIATRAIADLRPHGQIDPFPPATGPSTSPRIGTGALRAIPDELLPQLKREVP